MNSEQQIAALILKYLDINLVPGIEKQLYKNWFIVDQINNMVSKDLANLLVSESEIIRNLTKMLSANKPPDLNSIPDLYPLTITRSLIESPSSSKKFPTHQFIYKAYNEHPANVPPSAGSKHSGPNPEAVGIGPSANLAIEDLIDKLNNIRSKI